MKRINKEALTDRLLQLCDQASTGWKTQSGRDTQQEGRYEAYSLILKEIEEGHFDK